MKRLILASSSPRRIEILKNLGLEFEVIPSNFEESLVDDQPQRLVCKLAESKAKDVISKAPSDSIIIAADTVVVKDKRIFGKPKSQNEAYEMLRELSGSSHKVVTGICIVDNINELEVADYEETTVYFKELSDDEIWNYIKTGEPIDKAGAYGIQSLGGLFVKKIDGCYFNVMGLPVYKLYTMMGELGINILTEVVKNGK
ncbi:Maf family protein [Fonticella tunisiensis]|uniref:dTTP/UTP pyrophosphatase n=1 Tax=Fonticella tunisiensis TaxID=1096341 RepID=A0A4R7KR80_9CLOT|nr:Maf family protein [Fonticella tunisiensis]TDT61194.1 septum formation protein [Fonticella tunisiensis]